MVDCHSLQQFGRPACPLRVQVRTSAADFVSGLTASPDGVARLRAGGVRLLGGLLRLVPDDDAGVSRTALSALINLSQDEGLATDLRRFNVVGRVMEHIRDRSCPHIELLVRCQQH